jgi:hypothetical protein
MGTTATTNVKVAAFTGRKAIMHDTMKHMISMTVGAFGALVVEPVD